MSRRGELSFDQAVEADRLATLVGETQAIDAAVPTTSPGCAGSPPGTGGSSGWRDDARGV